MKHHETKEIFQASTFGGSGFSKKIRPELNLNNPNFMIDLKLPQAKIF